MADWHDGPVWALGTMSGTSMDGVDAALVLTDGVDVQEFGPTAYRPYTAQERALIRAALGRWPTGAGVAEAARIVETAHAEVMADLAPMAAIAGFHGQTLAHDPGGRGTHQAGSGARLAARLGVPVAWDMRSADVAAGGQGAPLVPFFHFALARRAVALHPPRAPVAFLNLGGVGNITWADPTRPGPGAAGALVAFDTGPANAPLDDLMHARLGLGRDEGGALAAQGQPDLAVVAQFLSHPYFTAPPPKSLDRDAFANLSGAVARLSDADAAATLVACAAQAVGAAMGHLPAPPAQLVLTGGGRHNVALVAAIGAALANGPGGVQVVQAQAAGLDGDMLEAQAFAYLAVRVARGLALSAPATTGVPAPQPGGRLSLP
jgi:anhydro-N-acetylmuramic acid kinase